jgi:hypothetical protein
MAVNVLLPGELGVARHVSGWPTVSSITDVSPQRRWVSPGRGGETATKGRRDDKGAGGDPAGGPGPHRPRAAAAGSEARRPPSVGA